MWRIHSMKLWNGMEIEIREHPDHRTVCPICGFLTGGDWPYFKQVTSEGQEIAAGSHDICPSCKTQYGDDDFVRDFPEMTQEQVWGVLRQAWVRKVGKSTQVADQLKNLDIDVESIISNDKEN